MKNQNFCQMCFGLIFLFIPCLIAEGNKCMNLMPAPKQIVWKEGAFRVGQSFSFAIEGEGQERVRKNAIRMMQRLSAKTALFFRQDFLSPLPKDSQPLMLISFQKKGNVVLKEDESYRLTITQDRILLDSPTDLGSIRGMETLLQLLEADEKGYFFPALEIQDEPRFPWRGLLMDVCRHYMPVEVIKRNLDAMAAVKMNVFHWHLSEDQGFRVESKLFPKLHEMGSDGLYYSQQEIRNIVAYAQERGIRVVPEFDMPGHATSWFVGYPELASIPGSYSIDRTYGVKDPAMDPSREETYQFLDAFWGEMASLFPDEYFHIGGDENNGKMWDKSPNVQAFMKAKGIADNHALQAYFNKRILQILTKYGKKLVGWDEILHPDMPKNIVIQSWRGPRFLVESAQKGYMGILSNGYYIDLVQSAQYHYANDPIPMNSPLTPLEKEKILGGEATMWAELVTPENVDSRIWPRTAAIAERLWSPPSIIDVSDMYRRLAILSMQLEELGITHLKNYPMMLRRLARSTEIEPLKTLADIVEPLEQYSRHMQGIVYHTYYPLCRLADAVPPESTTARHFNNLVEDFLADKNSSSSAAIESFLALWRDNEEKLLPMIQRSPALHEIHPLSQAVKALSIAGLDSIHYIRAGQKPGDSWIQEKEDLLIKTRKPYAETEIMIHKGIEKLVQKANKK